MIKVFIVDDSLLVREKIKEIFKDVEDIQVIGEATNPIEALSKFKEVGWPDVFILDIEMPKMDGLTFLQKIMEQRPTSVIMCSTLVERGSAYAIDAMRMGAVDIVLKPTAQLSKFFDEVKEEFIRKVKAAAKANLVAIKNIKRITEDRKLSENNKPMPISKKIVAIGSSTGGVQTIEEILKNVRANHPPIVIVQHMPKGFTNSFAKRLDSVLSNSNVKEAEDGDVLMNGRILICPGGVHMEVEKDKQYRVRLKDTERVNGHKPSVDVLFYSMAKNVKDKGIGIILTGMGGDGAKGLLEMKKNGAKTYAQSEKTCVVYGMPKVAVEIGAVDEVVDLDEIANVINTLK